MHNFVRRIKWASGNFLDSCTFFFLAWNEIHALVLSGPSFTSGNSIVCINPELLNSALRNWMSNRKPYGCIQRKYFGYSPLQVTRLYARLCMNCWLSRSFTPGESRLWYENGWATRIWNTDCQEEDREPRARGDFWYRKLETRGKADSEKRKGNRGRRKKYPNREIREVYVCF